MKRVARPIKLDRKLVKPRRSQVFGSKRMQKLAHNALLRFRKGVDAIICFVGTCHCQHSWRSDCNFANDRHPLGTRCKHEFCYGCFAPFEGPTGINELGQAGHKVGCNPAHAPEELFAAGILFVLLVMLLFAFATWVVRTTVREVFNAANAAADFGRM